MRAAFLAVCAIVVCIVICGGFVAVFVNPPHQETVNTVAGRDDYPLNFLFSAETRARAFSGDGYSWGGTSHPQDRTIVAPVLVVIGMLALLVTSRRLPRPPTH